MTEIRLSQDPVDGGKNMTRNNAREIAVHLVFGLEFGARSAEEAAGTALGQA